MMIHLVFLLSLGGLVFVPSRQVLDRQDHHTFRTHWLRKPGVFASTEADVRKDEEEVGDEKEREDGQHVKSVNGRRSLRRRFLYRFDCLRSEVSRRANACGLD